MKKRLLHIAPDEKFINDAFKQFKGLSDFEHVFIVVKNKNNKGLKFVVQSDLIKEVSESNSTLKELSELVKTFDLVVLYGLNFFTSRLVLNSKARFLWLFLGGEIYNNKYALNETMLGNMTSLLKLKKDTFSFKNNILKPIVRKILYGYYSHQKTILLAAKKVNYFGVLHKEDYNKMIENNIFDSSIKWIKFGFYPLEFLFFNNVNQTVNGDNILIGNSSSATNNHFEVFEKLKTLSVKNRSIVVPLSYGDNEYADLISARGYEFFQTNFNPLRTFLSLQDYNKLVQSCGIVIMNHYRQQAVGNIIASLWFGAKVFLDERNTFYQYLKRIGIHVYSINNDLNKQEALDVLLQEYQNENRLILSKELSLESLQLDLKNQLINILND